MPSPRQPVLTALLAVSALGLTACGDRAVGASGASAGPGDGTISIVTATNVYGAIATAVGGDDVEVTSIVDGLGQDPHSYEATVQDKLAVTGADLVIRNGGGYDTFLGRLAEDAGSVTVLDAVGLTGSGGTAGTGSADDHAHEEDGHDHGTLNEHLWYSLPAMVTVAGAIADELGRLDEANAQAYRERADAFTADLRPLQDRLAALASGADGKKVAVTEPVPVYLLEAAGLENVTPEEFSEAVEEETDVPVAALNEMKQLVTGGQLAFLAYNGQTEGPQTEAVRSAADGAGLPVLEFTETLPDGDDYISWMTANTDAVQAALAR